MSTTKYYVQMLSHGVHYINGKKHIDNWGEPEWICKEAPETNVSVRTNWAHEVVLSRFPFEKQEVFSVSYCELEIPDDLDRCYILYHFHDYYFDTEPKKIYTNKKEATNQFQECIASQYKLIKEQKPKIKEWYGKDATVVVMYEIQDKITTSTLYEMYDASYSYPVKGSRWFLQTLVRGEDF